MQTGFDSLDNLLALDMEWRLTVAMLISQDDETCARYFIERRTVLMPEILLEAEKQGIDPLDLFVKYRKGVHERHV